MAKEKKGKIVKIIIAVLAVFIIVDVIMALSGKGSKDDTQTASGEKHGVTGIEVDVDPIENFNYEIKGEKVMLKSCDTSNSTLVIAKSYKIDGKKYKTDLSHFQVGIGNSTVETLILSEGIKKINNSAFNSSNVKRVYFPKTMKKVYDKTLYYLHPDEGDTIKIYYGGTQDEWKQIFKKYKAKSVKEAKTAEGKGTAAADKLNKMIGSHYDSSDFEYFFSASPEDLQ